MLLCAYTQSGVVKAYIFRRDKIAEILRIVPAELFTYFCEVSIFSS